MVAARSSGVSSCYAVKGLLVVLFDACPESYVGVVLLVGDAESLAGLVRVAGRVGPELGECVGASVRVFLLCTARA
jgi:hypothetical protein